MGEKELFKQAIQEYCNDLAESLHKQFFLKRDNCFYTALTKEEILNSIDNTKPETFLPYLRTLDYPYVKCQWEELVDRYGPESNIFSRYIAKMRLFSWRPFGFEDSDRFNEGWENDGTNT